MSTLYIIYNAKSTLLGKLNYVYRKAKCPDPANSPACAACELTHGPSLSLSESATWKQTKERILHCNIVQLHVDEMPESLRQWRQQEDLKTPLVVAEVSPAAYKVLLAAEDLAQVRSDHERFLQLLKSRVAEAGISEIVVNV